MNQKLKQQLTMNISNADAMHGELQEALRHAQVAIEAAPVGPALDPELAAELAELNREAGAEPPPPGSPEAVAAEEAASRPPVDLAGELAGLLLTITAVLKPALPSLAAIYTEQNCQAAGAAVAAVCNKHGWLQGGIVGGFGEELAALAVLGPMAVATYTGVKGDLAAAKRAASLTQPEPAGGVSLVDSVAAPLGA